MKKTQLINKSSDIGCKGRVRAVNVSEEKANDTLRYLEGLFNMDKYQAELKLNKSKSNP